MVFWEKIVTEVASIRPAEKVGVRGLAGAEVEHTSARFHRVTTFPDHRGDGSAEHI